MSAFLHDLKAVQRVHLPTGFSPWVPEGDVLHLAHDLGASNWLRLPPRVWENPDIFLSSNPRVLGSPFTDLFLAYGQAHKSVNQESLVENLNSWPFGSAWDPTTVDIFWSPLAVVGTKRHGANNMLRCYRGISPMIRSMLTASRCQRTAEQNSQIFRWFFSFGIGPADGDDDIF